ncbi:MAG: recombinase family protein [Candidatus Sulfotelmatobacter sp.]
MFCTKQGWEIVSEYIDRVSGKHSDREKFQAMFAAASRREFDVVVFWSLDRFSREGTVETLQHLQRLTSYGVAWRSFTEQYSRLDGNLQGRRDRHFGGSRQAGTGEALGTSSGWFRTCQGSRSPWGQTQSES